MALTLLIATAGRAALVNAQNTGTAPVTVTQIGFSETAVVAAAGLTALDGEFKRISGVGGAVVADDTIHVVATDDSADAYSLRSFALYLDDGTLFAIYGQPTPILEKAAASYAGLALDVIFADIDATDLTFGNADFLVPPATTERQGVVELATVAEAQAGIDALRALTPAAAKAAILGWLLTVDGPDSGLNSDLLDGQHGAYYSNIPARLGYTPLNAATYTPADILAKLLTVDGPDSSLDAAFLRGKTWTSGQDVTFGVVNAQTPNDGSTGGLRLHANPASLLAHFQVVTADGAVQWGYWQHSAAGEADWLGGAGLRSNGNPVWHAGNLDPSVFAHVSDFSTGSNDNGRWWRTPDFAGHSVLEQHGFVGPTNPSGQGVFTINFPTPFLDTNYYLQLTTRIPAAGDYDNFFQEIAGTRTVNSVQVYSQDPSDGGLSNSAGFSWMAKGY